MKIIGGTFGNSGKVSISDANEVVITSAKNGKYDSSEVSSIESKIESTKNFSIFSLIIGGIFLTLFGVLVAGFLGGALGFAIAIAGSFYTTKTNIAYIIFSDSNCVEVSGSSRQIKKLYTLTNNR